MDLTGLPDYYDYQSDEEGAGEDELPNDEDWEEITDSVSRTGEPVKGFRPPVEFKVNDPGPRGFEANATEESVFTQIMGGDEFWQKGTDMTNLYATQHNRRRWKTMDVCEFKCFIGSLLYMGCKRVSRAQAFK